MNSANEITLGWSDIEVICRDIVKQLRGEYDIVVPIARGGLCPGAIIADMLGITNVRSIRWQTRDGYEKDYHDLSLTVQAYERVLIVDDILDSGKCLCEISEAIRKVRSIMKDQIITYAVLLKNVSYEHHDDQMYNLVYGRKFDRTQEDRYVVFPWNNTQIKSERVKD